jgi:type 1 glutamine amidotransferase
MRNLSVFTGSLGLAVAGLVVALGACSDGSGQVAGAAGTGTTDPNPTTAGTTGTPTAGTSTGPTAGTTGTGMGGTGNTPTGGTGPTNGGANTAGTAPTAGTSAGGAAPTAGSGGSGGSAPDAYSGNFKVLILSTTLDFPHDSIPDCQAMVSDLGKTADAAMPAGTKPGSQFTTTIETDDLPHFTATGLKEFGLIFSCNPTGTVFSANSKVKDKVVAMSSFQTFVESGGGWVGVHSATDFEKSNGFPWFVNTLVGATFKDHDADGTPGTVQAVAALASHPVMKGMPAAWSTSDEWYIMNRDVSAQPGFQIMQRLASDNRAVAWAKELGTGGRSFYTIRGHNKKVYKEADFRKQVLNGILWATHRLNQ